MRIIQQTEDFQLLRRFVEDGSQEAFGLLMQRHLNLVFSVCRREVGDMTLAEDVTQAVFLILAQKAPRIREGTLLSGWLFKTSRFAAKNALRQEAQRQAGEREVIAEMMQRAALEESPEVGWQAIEPLLHDGLTRLGAKDREAILLRYFESRSFKEVGLVLGLSENTARMRVERAIEKLKLYLQRHGVPVSATILSGLLAEQAVQAAPASCATAVAGLAANSAAAGVGAVSTALVGSKAAAISQGALKIMLLNNIKVAVVVAGLSLAATEGGVWTLRDSTANGMLTPAANDMTTPTITYSDEPSSNLVGKPMPSWDIEPDLWMNTQRPPQWSGLKGRVTVIEFFRVQCSHCQTATSSRRALYLKYQGRGLRYIGFQSPGPDPTENNWNKVQGIVRTWQLPYPIAFDAKGVLFKKCGLRLYPTVLVVDRQGVVRFQQVGYEKHKAKELEQFIAEILKSQAINEAQSTPARPLPTSEENVRRLETANQATQKAANRLKQTLLAAKQFLGDNDEKYAFTANSFRDALKPYASKRPTRQPLRMLRN